MDNTQGRTVGAELAMRWLEILLLVGTKERKQYAEDLIPYITTLEATTSAQAARVKELEDALKPFVAHLKGYDIPLLFSQRQRLKRAEKALQGLEQHQGKKTM